MVQSLLFASSLLLPCAFAAGLYPKGGSVINIDGRSYESLIAKSNHTSIVEFYAPWCGHCQNLKPAYEKAAKSLSGLAKVAAINCDDEENKPFCGSMGVKGFPTLKIVRPNLKKVGGRPSVEDYQGARTAKAIVEAVIDRIPNFVSRLKEADLGTWTSAGGHRAVLFTEKGTVSALLKSLAVDYLGAISFGQFKGKAGSVATKHNIEKLPTLLLLPGNGGEPTTYTGEMKRDGIVAFLKSVAAPNPDPPAKAQKTKSSKTDKAKASKDSSAYSAAASSHASSEAQPTQKVESIVDDGSPIPSPDPQVGSEKPIKVPEVAPPIPALRDGLSLQQKCLNDKSGTCILLLLPESHPDNPYPEESVASLSEIHAKHKASGRKLFPFYQLPVSNSQAIALRKSLALDDGVEIIAINAKRSWWRRYEHAEFAQRNVEDWIDKIRMGDGKKETLPATVVIDSTMLPQDPVQLESDDLQKMKENIAQELPEGVKVDFEEITDAEYENLMHAAEKEEQNKAESHDEL